tara:strand:+ start:65 stop:1249 length:1185 start_codon:yes stop_codon:yes gene_type:complete
MSNFISINIKELSKKPVSEIFKESEKNGINTKKTSEKSGKQINKTKKEVLEELNRLQQEEIIKNQNEINNLGKSEEENIYQKGCSRILVYAENMKKRLRKANEEEKNKLMSKEYIEETFDVKFEFGSFIYFGDYYIINHENKLVLCDEWCPEQSMEDELYIEIPNEICEKLTCAPTFFGLIGNEHNEKCRKTKSNYECNFYDKFMISGLFLSNTDKYFKKKFGKIEDTNGIQIKYFWNEYDCEYNFKAIVPYIDNDKPLSIDDLNNIDDIILNKDITFERILEYQDYISNTKYKHYFFKSGPIENDEDPIWSESVEISEINKLEEEGDLNYSCYVTGTNYHIYNNSKNIKEQFKDKEKSNNMNEKVLINWYKFFDKKTIITEVKDFSDLIYEVF